MNPTEFPEIDGGYSLEHHVEGESRRLAAPLRALDFEAETRELRSGDAWRELRQESKTLIKLPNLLVVLVALKAGRRIDRHRTDGEVTLQILSGHARVQADGHAVDLPAGRLVAIERSIPHDLVAEDDSTVLLTVAWRRSGQ